MSKLKPQLILTGSNKKKGSFAGGIGSFLLLVAVFVLGVYVGMKLDSTDLSGDMFSRDTQSSQTKPENTNIEMESEKPISDTPNKSESNIYAQDVSTELKPKNNAIYVDEDISNIDQNTGQLDNSSMPSSVGNSPQAENIESISQPVNFEPNDLSLEDAYRLQVAAFSNLDDANEIVNELKLKGYNAYILTTSNSRGEVWNLIKIGNFNTANEAWDFSEMYQNKEGGEVFVESLNKGRVYNRPVKENSEVNTLDENNVL